MKGAYFSNTNKSRVIRDEFPREIGIGYPTFKINYLRMKGMKVLANIVVLSISLFVFTKVNAQIPDPVYNPEPLTLSVIGKSFGDSILVRWAPHYPEAWLMGNKYGYDLFRYKIKENDSTIIDNPIRIKLQSAPIKPMPIEEIEQKYKTDKYASIVAQAIYGESFELYSNQGTGNIMNKALEIENRYSFSLFASDISVKAALAHGLIYIDKNIEANASYVYVIKPAWNDTMALIDSALLYIAVNDTSTPPKPIELVAKFGDKMVDLSWNFEDMETVFTSYFVERSDDGGKTFNKVNKNPIVNITGGKDQSLKRIHYIDTLPDNERYYTYRVRGITPFGELSQASDLIEGVGVPQEFGLNPINTSSPMQDSEVIEIKWEFDPTLEHRIQGFIVERAASAKGSFQLISDTLNYASRSFTDMEPMGAAYYQVCAVSKIRGAYCSFPALVQLPDSIPPAIPTGVQAVIDSTGIVTLTWNRNNETDLFCYSVFKANNPKGDFVKINQMLVTDTVYTDTVTLGTLTKNVYYGISASDKHYNESARSLTIQVIRPDTIAPAAPSFKKYEVSPSGIHLVWNSSPSNDVVKQVLYRRNKDEESWLVVAVFDSISIMEYEDTDVLPNEVYDYLILAVDESGLESDDNQVVSIKALAKIDENLVALKLSTDEDRRQITIEWKSKTKNLKEIILYKSVDGGKFQLLHTTQWDAKSYTDANVKRGHTYSYRTQTINNNKTRSKISEPYSVNF